MPELTTMSAADVHKFAAENVPGLVEVPKGPDKKRICLGLLSYDGNITARTSMCLAQAVMQCAAQGWGFTYILREGDSMVARGRSFIASQFLENPASANCTDLVFVDTDLSWDGNEFIRLCSHDVDVVGGAYPYKDESGDFPLRWGHSPIEEENSLWGVQAVTPGFLRISRRALEKISREKPWLEFNDRGNAQGQRSWMFFDNIHRPSGIYDEGYIFCEHWRSVGGKVWLDPHLNITHIGRKAFNHGTIGGWLERKAQAVDRLVSEYPEVPDLILVDKLMGREVDLEAAKKASAA